ncbi:MAG: class I SAM-dependent methyltransferase [Bdellovibrionota bacterium]
MNCRVCKSTKLQTVIDLGNQPWGNHFLKPAQVGKEPFYPLRVVFCDDCTTAQLDYTVAKEVMFGDHTYLSGMTRSLDRHFEAIAQTVDSRFFVDKKQKSILDIGSNDGTQLKHYKKLGYEIVGVESSETTAKHANASGIHTLNEYFDAPLVKRLGRKFDVINASGVFFHLEELHSVTKGIEQGLADDGVFVVQFLYMKKILENLAFDQIYHEHLLYYTISTIKKLLVQYDLELFDAELAPVHGGSIIGFVGHKGRRPRSARLAELEADEDRSQVNRPEAYREFGRKIAAKRETDMATLRALKAKGKKIYGMGAPVKGNTLLNYYGITPDLISSLVEINPMRRGLVAPGSHIPIVMEDEVAGNPPDVYYVLAWNFKREILERHADLVAKGVEFLFPVIDGA